MPIRKLTDKRFVQELEGDLVVYDQDKHKVYHLNQPAAVVWEACEDCDTIADLTRVLAANTKLPADNQVTRLALQELRDAGLIEGDLDGSGDMIVSRRQVTESLGRAAIALPTVGAMFAPTAAMAQSAPPTPGPEDS